MAQPKNKDNSDVERIKEEMKERSAVEAPPPTTSDATPEASDQHLSSDLSWYYVAADWQRLKGRIRETWPKLTDDELERVAGDYDRFIGSVAGNYGLEPAAAKEQVHTWLRSLDATSQ